MPKYEYVCEKCKVSIEIDRKVHDNEVPPTTEETVHTSECDHKWKKIIGRTTWVRGSNFVGRKGHWLFLLGWFL